MQAGQRVSGSDCALQAANARDCSIFRELHTVLLSVSGQCQGIGAEWHSAHYGVRTWASDESLR